MLRRLVIALIPLMLATSAAIARTPAAENTSLYFIEPHDGDIVSNPVTVVFGLKGMGVAPAGTDKENTGHHHLLIDLPSVPVMDKPIPADKHHKHFGGGQTETTVELPPGKHTLQLLLADRNHIPHDPPVISKKITVTVQ
ncbi:MAG: rod shape-determining protein RodA [Thiothrix sp.]|nr:MAG: rod shape-determining protein RodA [Thiothrix sp.]